ncbi:MULE transposase [Hirsutella rhossiliensis]
MEIQYRDSLPDDVRSGFDKAVEALPQEHLRAPVTGDEVNSPEEALHWFQNYAFTQGFALVTASKIRLGRRFVSGFLMQTDATFNTNCLHLPLSVIAGITNTGKTFPLAFAFITSESAEAFEFVNAQLAKLVWYDCPPPQVVLGDQTKGLAAAMAASQAS